MKKLIILNFVFLLLLNLLLLIKEYFFITYNLNSKFDDFTYWQTNTQGSFGFGVFQISFWWVIYFFCFSIFASYTYQYLKNRIKKIQLLILLIILQTLLCFLVNKLVIMNIFGFFKVENILFSVVSLSIFWYFRIYKTRPVNN